MKGQTTQGLDLFIRCIQDLIDADNFHPIFLYNIKTYVSAALFCETLRLKSEQDRSFTPDYISIKETVEQIAEENGYPKLKDLDKHRPSKKTFATLKVVR